MQNKLEEGLAAIKQARQYVKEADYSSARDEYVKGLGLLHRVYSEEKNPQKKDLLKKNMNQYLQEAEINKQNLQRKQANLQHGWIGMPTKPVISTMIDVKPPTQIKQPLTKKQFNQSKKLEKQHSERNKAQIKGIDQDIQSFILTNIKQSFNDMMGMSDIKRIIQETIILPRLRPDIFQGLRSPPRGILLYGPPGNGKTFIAKVVAHESGCTFFNLSASSLVSKFMGDSQRMLRKIFAAAYQLAPSIIFIDEIDSILTSRRDNEEEHCRRLKTEFLTQMQGLSTSDTDQVIVIAATNLPQQLDKAALRRFAKKIYIGVPNLEARISFLQKILAQVPNSINKYELQEICRRMDDYSSSDINAVAAEACNIPVREVELYLKTIDAKNIRNVSKQDFLEAIDKIPPTITKKELLKYVLNS